MTRQFFALFVAIFALGLTSCTKYNYTYVHDPITHEDKTMWDYFSTDTYNWKLTQEMITHAGLRDLFEGKSQYGNELTFFGITDFSILRYLKENQVTSVQDLPAEQCKEWILTNLYPKRVLLDDWVEGAKVPNEIVGQGGQTVTMLSGKQLWIYAYREPYNGVVGMGPKKLHLVSLDKQANTEVQSHNIQTKTGVVHALSYNFTPNDF